jgi:ferredoxin/flavodoxin---NADP+ reductase
VCARGVHVLDSAGGIHSSTIKRFVIEAPRTARKHQAGQFVILRLHEQGERIPLAIESSNAKRGTISIVAHAVGKTTNQLNALETGDCILDVEGPLGNPGNQEFWDGSVIGGGNGSGSGCGVEGG